MDILVENLSYQYPDRGFALRIGRLAVKAGERIAITGPSGSGKTTFLRILSGIYPPDTGEIKIGPTAVHELSEARRRAFRITRIGFVFQDFQLLDYLNVEENIRLPFRLNHVLKWNAGVAERLQELTCSAGIEDKLRRPVDRLSHGEKQRVALCRALVTAPSLLLADEPTGNLDSAARDRVMELIFREVDRRNTTLLVVTHDPALLGRFDRVMDCREWTGEGDPA